MLSTEKRQSLQSILSHFVVRIVSSGHTDAHPHTPRLYRLLGLTVNLRYGLKAMDKEEDQRQLRRKSTIDSEIGVDMAVPEGVRGWYRAPGAISFERDDRAGLSILDYNPPSVPASAVPVPEKSRKRGFSLTRKKRKPAETNAVQRRAPGTSSAPRQANSMLMSTEQRLAIMMMVRDGNMSIDEAAALVERKESVLQQSGAARKPELKLG